MHSLSFAAIDALILTLPPNCRPAHQEQRRLFQNQVEAVLEIYFLKLPPTHTASGFGILSEKVDRRRSTGGRPRHASMDTLVLALADAYAKTTANQIEALPVSESSRFVNFMSLCLDAHYENGHLAGALARRWRDLRKAIRASPPQPNYRGDTSRAASSAAMAAPHNTE